MPGSLTAHLRSRAVIGLRYFNVFGPRQDPNGAYAAVIPRWIGTLLSGGRPQIHGDGKTSRDFCPVANAVQANLLAAGSTPEAHGRSFNVALGERTDLNQLYAMIHDGLVARGRLASGIEPEYDNFRPGDVRHSLADLESISALLGYEPKVDIEQGLGITLDWFLERA